MLDIGIVGAGLSSLYAACYLAKHGHKVSVFEKNAMSGGRSQTFTADGFTFDMGPSWYWMPELIDKMFNDLGEKRTDYYNLKRLDPAYRVFWKDRTYTDVPANKKALEAMFDNLETNGGSTLDKFLKDAKVKYDIATKDFLELPGLKLTELLQLKALKAAFKLDVFKSVERDVHSRFSSDKARSILDFPVLFLGALPGNIPSLYTLMNYADLELGTWYPENGMHDLASALEKIARKEGVEFHFNAKVDRIEASNGAVKGLIVNDEVMHFDQIISGADYHFTEQKLLPKEYRRYTQSYWDKRQMAPSSLIFYLGFDKKIKGLDHHNLFFDEDLKQHGAEIYTAPDWPSKPLFYACTPSKTDSRVAPEGKENVFILMPLAPDVEDNDELREKYLSIILERMERHLGISLKDQIIFKRSFCVSDFKSEYNSFKGNAYGLANTLNQTANLKPKMKSKLKGFYFCGQLTVPGPGIPPALISGKIAAKQIIDNL